MHFTGFNRIKRKIELVFPRKRISCPAHKFVTQPCDSISFGKVGAMSWAERDQIYDTSLIGYGNQGHAFADGLSVAERAALLEYLKTL